MKMEQSKAYLIILNSGIETADHEKTVESFLHVDIKDPITGEYIKTINLIDTYTFSNPKDLNETIQKAVKERFNWVILMYDNEVLSEGIRQALPVYFKMNTFDILILYKKTKENKTYMIPRVFKSTIEIDGDKMIPKGGYEGIPWETALDGWIKDQ